MKLRTDLLEFLTGQDILKEALATVHRYKAEPQFLKDRQEAIYVRRHLRERAQEIKRSEALSQTTGGTHEESNAGFITMKIQPFLTAMPYTCLHGRRTLIEMNYRELENV